MQNLKKSNRFLWVVLGVVLVAILGLGALSNQVSLSNGPTAAQALTAASTAPKASADAAPAASAPAQAKPASFLPDYQDPQPAAAPSGIGTIIDLAWKLALVVALIYGTVVGLRYFANRTRRAVMGDNAINVLEKTALAQNRELYLVDIADRVLLLGATTSTINVLTEITDAGALEDLRSRPQPALQAAEPFLNYLRKVGEHAKPIAAEVAATATSRPAELLKPADLLNRIEAHKQRLKESTLALRETEA